MNNTITLAQAKKMTTLFRAQRDSILSPVFQGKNLLPLSEAFERAAFDKVLARPGCVGLRIYYGMNEDLQLRAIIVGINEKGEDMLPSDDPTGTNEATTEEETIIEESIVCPPICPQSSPLNT